MPGRQEQRSEETRRSILAAAGDLFATRGYEAVTMREIARVAGCSHTTIYIYFKDKEALLHQLSMEPLRSLHSELEAALRSEGLSPDERLKRVVQVFLQFCFNHRTMYSILFLVQASRVDDPEPTLEVNKLRLQLFDLLVQGVRACLPPGLSAETALAFARIMFYNLHGIVGLYTQSPEPPEQVMRRLGSTFELSVEVLLAGFRQIAEQGGVSE